MVLVLYISKTNIALPWSQIAFPACLSFLRNRNQCRRVPRRFITYFYIIIYETYLGISGSCSSLSRALSSNCSCHRTNPRMCPVWNCPSQSIGLHVQNAPQRHSSCPKHPRYIFLSETSELVDISDIVWCNSVNQLIATTLSLTVSKQVCFLKCADVRLERHHRLFFPQQPILTLKLH
jgi:hypothetical protein